MIYIKERIQEEIDVLIKPCFQEEERQEKEYQQILAVKAFEGKEEEIFVLPHIENKINYTLYLGLGKK